MVVFKSFFRRSRREGKAVDEMQHHVSHPHPICASIVEVGLLHRESLFALQFSFLEEYTLGMRERERERERESTIA